MGSDGQLVEMEGRGRTLRRRHQQCPASAAAPPQGAAGATTPYLALLPLSWRYYPLQLAALGRSALPAERRARQATAPGTASGAIKLATVRYLQSRPLHCLDHLGIPRLISVCFYAPPRRDAYLERRKARIDKEMHVKERGGDVHFSAQ